jgi:hypothetical protein
MPRLRRARRLKPEAPRSQLAAKQHRLSWSRLDSLLAARLPSALLTTSCAFYALFQASLHLLDRYRHQPNRPSWPPVRSTKSMPHETHFTDRGNRSTRCCSYEVPITSTRCLLTLPRAVRSILLPDLRFEPWWSKRTLRKTTNGWCCDKC